MRQNEKPDNFWGEDFTDKKFEFKEEFWLAAEDLLEKDRKKSARRRIALIFFLFSFISLWGWWATNLHLPTLFSKNNLANANVIDTSDQLVASKYQIIPQNVFAGGDLLMKNDLDEEQAGILYAQKTGNTNIKFNRRANIPKAKVSDKDIASLNTEESTTPSYMKGLTVNELPLQKEIFLSQHTNSTFDPEQVIKKNVPKRNPFSLEVGVGKSLITDVVAKDFNQNYSLGFNYRVYNGNNISVHTGLHLSSLSTSGLDTTYTAKIYEFESRTREINIEYKRNYYVQFPVHLNYHFKQNTFGLGITASHLFAAETALEIFQNLPKYGKQKLGTINRNFGISAGMRKIIFDLNLSYHRTLNANVDIGLQANIGLTGLTENSFWNSSTVNRAIGAQVSLRYHFKNNQR